MKDIHIFNLLTSFLFLGMSVYIARQYWLLKKDLQQQHVYRLS